MMKSSIFTLVLCAAGCLAGSAIASELDDANQLLSNKKYPQALQAFDKLAKAGNSEAQLRLGEMYWYGEGVALDRARGDALFAQAAKSGNAAAREAMQLSGQRAARGADIALWTGRYDGAELRAGKFACPAPQIPPVSTTNAEMKIKSDEINAWIGCYNGIVANVEAALPPGKSIPGDVLVLMSDQEIEQAKLHLDKVLAQVGARAKADADKVMAQRDAWNKATLAYAEAENQRIATDTKMSLLQQELNERKRSANPAPPKR